MYELLAEATAEATARLISVGFLSKPVMKEPILLGCRMVWKDRNMVYDLESWRIVLVRQKFSIEATVI